MQKREKVIIGLMVLAVLYAAWAYIFDPVPEKQAQATADQAKLQGMMGSARAIVDKAKLSPLEERRLALVTGAAPGEPFYRMPPAKAAAEEKATALKRIRELFTFNGLIEAGRKRLAVINGNEYAAGDELETRGYFLTRVEAQKAVVEQRTKDNVVLERIELQLDEDVSETPSSGNQP